MPKMESIAALIRMSEALLNENTRLRKELSDLDTMYQEMADDYIKIQMELNDCRMCQCIDDESDSHTNDCECPVCIPVADMATTHPEYDDVKVDIMPSPASVGHSMITGTTDQPCFSLTAVLAELEQGVSVSKRILQDQNLFQYKTDDSGSNRYTPTNWFREYGLAHGILAEFTGHATTPKGQKTFTWYKITGSGKDIIKDTASGMLVWKKFNNGPSDWDGYIPVPSDASNSSN